MTMMTHYRSTQKLNQWLFHGFKCKLGPKCDKNIKRLADAPSFYHIVGPQLGYGWGSKPSKQAYDFKYDLRHITEVSKI